jgi:hypothetical protein
VATLETLQLRKESGSQTSFNSLPPMPSRHVPTIPVKVGRTDSDQASPLGVIPHGNAGAVDLIKLFGKIVFSPSSVLQALI